MLRATLLSALLLVIAYPADAQRAWSGGFAAAGGAEADSRYLDGDWTFSFGWDTRYAVRPGLELGVRGTADYARFEPDEEAFADSLGVGAVEAQGGAATVVGTGFDLLAGYQVGAFGGYGFAGVRYVRDNRNELTLRTGGGAVAVRGESRGDLGRTWGAGVTWRFGRAGVLAEWFRLGGFDQEMIQVEGLRVGVTWSW